MRTWNLVHPGASGMSRADLEISRVAGRQHGVLSIARLRAIGLSEAQIRRRVLDRRLHRLHRGVYAVGHKNLGLRGRWLGAVLALGRGALLSQIDAAALWNLRAPSDGPVHVLTAGGSRSRRRGIAVHRSRLLHPDDRGLVDRIPVTSVARTLLDIAATRPRTQLQRAFEQAEHQRLLDARAIEASLLRSNGHAGSARLAPCSTTTPPRPPMPPPSSSECSWTSCGLWICRHRG
jgi:predicted transcriptional regulator of viral defense system